MLEKIVEKNILFFGIIILDLNISEATHFELPIVLNENLIEFEFIYIGLNCQIGKAYNGDLVKLDPEKKDDKGESSANPKKATKSSGKAKKVFIVFAVLLCLALVVVFVLWKKNKLYKL